LEYKLVSPLGDTVAYFPINGWTVCTVGDIANALHVRAMSNPHFENAAETLPTLGVRELSDEALANADYL